MATKLEGREKKRLSGQYHYGYHTGLFHYVKKTGYLVKSPTSVFGRWRKRWFMLVDLVAPDGKTGTPSREVRLEYYSESIGSNQDRPKLKGNEKKYFTELSCLYLSYRLPFSMW